MTPPSTTPIKDDSMNLVDLSIKDSANGQVVHQNNQ